MQPAPAATLRTRQLAPIDAWLRGIGDWLQRHQGTIRTTQWSVVGVYVVLVGIPAFLPAPSRHAHLWSDLVLFAQFAFWGVWWPFAILSMALVGRLWCGLLCPEGTLTEFASARGRGRAIPHWILWRGWPVFAFAATTVYGQMVSVYQYPRPALLILGGSTLAAIAVGALYGRHKRVWCRYLCPVTGVFAVLSKLAPVHFDVDRAAWQATRKPPATARVNCAPLVPIRTMRGAEACHMCGRCSGYRGAITLARRSPNHAILHIAASEPNPMETVLIVFGLIGLAAGAFLWTSSTLFVDVKQALAGWLVDRGQVWPLDARAPWWILTNYPDRNDIITLLDGAVLLGYLAATAVLIGGAVSVCLVLSARLLGPWSSARFHHLAQGLIPLAGCGVFLGLSSLTVTLLRAEGLSLGSVSILRAGLLAGACAWSAWLGWRIAGRYAPTRWRRIAAAALFLAAVAAGGVAWTGVV